MTGTPPIKTRIDNLLELAAIARTAFARIEPGSPQPSAAEAVCSVTRLCANATDAQVAAYLARAKRDFAP